MALILKMTTKAKELKVEKNNTLSVQALPNENYEVVDDTTNKTPSDITVSRVGSNLLLQSASAASAVELKGFWQDCNTNSPCFVVLDTPEAAAANASKVMITQNENVLASLNAGQVGTLADKQTMTYEKSVQALPNSFVHDNALSIGALSALGIIVHQQQYENRNKYSSNTPTPSPTPTPSTTFSGEVALSKYTFKQGDTAFAVISLDQAKPDFSAADLTIDNGTLSGLKTLDGGRTWTALFTPNTGVEDATNVIKINNLPITRSIHGQSDNYVIDTKAPNAPVITLADSSDTGVKGDNGTNQKMPTFNGTGEAGDTITLSYGQGFTQTALVDATGHWSVTLNNALLEGKQNIKAIETDVAGNVSPESAVAITLDFTAPRWNDGSFGSKIFTAADNTGPFTFHFSEPVMSTQSTDPNVVLSLDDFTAKNGTLSNLATADGGTTWTATFTTPAQVNTELNWVTLNTHYQDLYGNVGEGVGWGYYSIYTVVPTGGGGTIPFSTIPPTPTIQVLDRNEAPNVVSTILADTGSVRVHILFDIPVVNFGLDDLQSSAGTFSGFYYIGNSVYSALFTPFGELQNTTATINVLPNYQSYSGTAGVAASSSPITVDTLVPSVNAINLSSSSFTATDTPTVHIVFTEKVKNFNNSDVTVDGGSLSPFASADGGITWNAIFTPTSGYTGSGHITVQNHYNDLAGNVGLAATSPNYTIM